MNLEALAPILLAYAWKGALILVAAAIVERVLYRAAAALRHAVWTLAMAGLILLPLASLVAPSLTIAVAAPGYTAPPPPAPASAVSVPAPSAPVREPVVEP